MTLPDLYLLATINRHRLATDHWPLATYLRAKLQTWRHTIEALSLAGSHAKGTALRDSDLDFFLTVSSGDPISQIQRSLADHIHGQLRNVSVRMILNNQSIDLVPARGNILWQARFDTWLKTDIQEQIRYVRDSGLINEILALKIWRRRHALRFPSFLMELAVIRALRPDASITAQFLRILNFLATGFPTTRLVDPANSNNVVSDILTPTEKSRIATAAQMSLLCPTWPDIL